MLLFCGWMAVLQYLQYSLAEAINLRNINVAQYAVLLSNVGTNACNDQALEDFARTYGDVVSAFYVRDFGRFFSKDTEVLMILDLLPTCSVHIAAYEVWLQCLIQISI